MGWRAFFYNPNVCRDLTNRQGGGWAQLEILTLFSTSSHYPGPELSLMRQIHSSNVRMVPTR